jgi:hypothetical protein
LNVTDAAGAYIVVELFVGLYAVMTGGVFGLSGLFWKIQEPVAAVTARIAAIALILPLMPKPSWVAVGPHNENNKRLRVSKVKSLTCQE